MEKKHKHHKGGKTHIPAADSFKKCDHSGWMTKLFHDGWLKKRWKKRYCVLSNGILYLYEKQASKGTEGSNIAIDLTKFSDCIKASAKESKKSPNTIILEPIKSTGNASNEKGHNNNVAREYFFTDDAADIDKWLTKLKESLSLSCSGVNAKLQHVTKSRARPPKSGGGNRRPPTKQHLHDRARMSEIVLDTEQEEPERKTGRGSKPRIPVIAMKPPGKPLMPSSTTNPENSSDLSQENLPLDEPESAHDLSSQQTHNESELPEAKAKSPPMLPPAALKPKTKPQQMETVDGIDEKNNEDEKKDISSDEEAHSNLITPDEDPSNHNIVSPKRNKPPLLPPAALKPKLIAADLTPPAEEQSDAEDEDEVDPSTPSPSKVTLGKSATPDKASEAENCVFSRSLTNIDRSHSYDSIICRSRSNSI